MSKWQLKQKLYLFSIFTLTGMIVYFSGKTIQINLEKNNKEKASHYFQKSEYFTKSIQQSKQIKLAENLPVRINSPQYQFKKAKTNRNIKYILTEILGITHLIISK
jgi:hypothetical protein